MESYLKNKKDNENWIMQFQDDDFDYLLILDFEAQCLEGEKLAVQEIIEFPVVVYDLKNQKIALNKTDGNPIIFHQYIKPVEVPILTEYCKNLTGISQEQVDNGLILQDALKSFDEFLNINKIPPNKFCFVTSGDWDLMQCLRREAKYKKIQLKDYFKRWINVKNIFFQYIGYKAPAGMVTMLQKLNLRLDGRHHSGIDDAKNITKIVDKLIKNGMKFKSKFLTRVK